MADNVIEQTAPQVEVAPPQDDFKAQLAEQMAISLNLNSPPPVQAPAQDVPQDVPHGTATVEQPVTEPQPVSDPFNLLKDKFSYQSAEDAIREIEELRAFKEQPRLPEFKVPDDTSGRILKALAAGNRKEVYEVLDREMRLDRMINAEVNKDTAADIVKLGMQLKYKDLTPDEIDYKFKKQFAVPPKPERSDLEDDVEYQARLQSWQDAVTDKQMELMIEAKLAKPELQNAKANIIFPEIESPVDDGYIQYKKMLEEQARVDGEIKAAYKALSPKSIETKLNFKDEENKIDFQFQFEPNVEKFARAAEIAADMNEFSKFFTKPDGTPDREGLVEAIYFKMDKENYLRAALNQSKNATIKAQLPDNSQGGLNRQAPVVQETNELDSQMRLALRGFGGF